MSGAVNCGACGADMALDCWPCNYADYKEGVLEAREQGAAVAFGLMGMAEAIREQQTAKAIEKWRNPSGHAGVPCGSPDRSKAAPTCFVTPAERAFIADMRRSAASGVGYGWMQQMIEVEWNAMVTHGGWGPAYFERRISELRQRIEELESDTRT